jgi:hypothetical protein
MNEPSAFATRAYLRHTVATLSYRAGKVLRDAPPGFGDFSAGPGTRTPAEILAHIVDLLGWALTLARGAQTWHNTKPGDWQADVARFYEALAAFDAYLVSDAPLGASVERLFQGPVADALTHVGQLAFLRRLANSPIRGENYFVADIAAGRTGSEQSDPRREFD